MAAFLSLALLTHQHAGNTIIAAVAVLFGAVLPFLFLLYLLRSEKVTKIDVPLRSQRTGPYLISVLIYIAGFVVLLAIGASTTVYALMFCYATNTLVISAINTKWKISAHAMGSSGPLTALAVTFGWPIVPFFMLVVLVGWARVELKAHTRAQVAVGALLGILLTAFQVEALYKLAGAG